MIRFCQMASSATWKIAAPETAYDRRERSAAVPIIPVSAAVASVVDAAGGASTEGQDRELE